MRIALISAICLAGAAAGAGAEPVGSLAVNYNIDLGPMTVTEVKYRLSMEGGAARSQAQIRSSGISRVFAEYMAKVEAESRAGADDIAPVRFHLVREKDEKTREAKLRWTGPGAIDYAPKEKKPERRARVDKALNDKVADPMTAVLKIGTAGDYPCPSAQQIFDGRDVYELSLADQGEGRIETEGYKGPVRRCEVSWTPIAGRAAEKNEPRESYEVSFAPVGELPSGRTLWVPVSLSGKLKGLRFDGYATKLTMRAAGGQALSQE